MQTLRTFGESFSLTFRMTAKVGFVVHSMTRRVSHDLTGTPESRDLRTVTLTSMICLLMAVIICVWHAANYVLNVMRGSNCTFDLFRDQFEDFGGPDSSIYNAPG